jgi:hypothetical protein
MLVRNNNSDIILPITTHPPDLKKRRVCCNGKQDNTEPFGFPSLINKNTKEGKPVI